MHKSVSVIVAAKTDQATLERCLRSVREQTYPARLIETVVAHSDMSPIIEKLKENFPEVIFMECAKPGPAAARNLAVEHSTGEVLAFLDADCRAASDWLETGMAVCGDAPDYFGFIGGAVEKCYVHPKNPTAMERYSMMMDFDQRFFIEDLCFSVTANMITLRSVWDTVGPFDEKNFPSYGGEDHDWGIRVLREALSMQYLPSMIVSHPVQSSVYEFRRKTACIAKAEKVLRQKHGMSNRSLIARIKTVLSRAKNILLHKESGGPLMKIRVLRILFLETWATRLSL